MGNYFFKLNQINNNYKFIKNIMIDKELNIILGIYYNKLDKKINQGIYSDFYKNNINEIKYVIKQKGVLKIFYNFNNGIRLSFEKDNITNNIIMKYKDNNFEFNKIIEPNVYNKWEPINDNSEEIDMLFFLINN